MGIEVIKDEADKRQFDGLALKNQDPEKHYRWARDRDMAISRHKYNGYDIVDSSSDRVRSACDDTTRMKRGAETDTRITLGDLVLMSTSKDNYERRMREEADRMHRQTRGVTAGYKQAVARLGGTERAGYEEHDDRNYAGNWTERDHDEQEARERERKGR